MGWITAEALDGMYGQAAGAIGMRLDRADGGGWLTMARGKASGTGRIDDWDCPPADRGLYRIVLDSNGYFAALGLSSAYPEVSVIVRVDERERCHVQVVLSPHAYSAHICVAS